MSKTIFVLCAHDDDQVLGAGGTIAKYIKEGFEVHTFIFSYGERSHPWLQRKATVEMRVKESKRASKVLGVRNVSYLGFREGKFREEANKGKIKSKIKRLFNEKKPFMVFTHSADDPHPDHRAVYDIVMSIVDSIHYRGEVYSFNVWNPINIKSNQTRLVVDVSETFKTKLKAIHCFSSQKVAIYTLLGVVVFNAFKVGLRNDVRFAEVFLKVR